MAVHKTLLAEPQKEALTIFNFSQKLVVRRANTERPILIASFYYIRYPVGTVSDE